jgi:hypothetical protein
MAVMGAFSRTVLWVSDSGTSGTAGLVAGVSAAPGLLLAGAPLSGDERYPLAVVASVPLWLVLGFLASRRATRSTIASWRDYWREMLFLTLAVIAGGVGALLVATASLGESLV